PATTGSPERTATTPTRRAKATTSRPGRPEPTTFWVTAATTTCSAGLRTTPSTVGTATTTSPATSATTRCSAARATTPCSGTPSSATQARSTSATAAGNRPLGYLRGQQPDGRRTPNRGLGNHQLRGGG